MKAPLDIQRYLPIVRFLGWAGVALGAVLFGIARTVGMPVQCPFVIMISVVILLLAWRAKTPAPTSINR